MVAGDEWKMRVAMGGPMGVITGTFQAHQRLIDSLSTRAAMQNASISKGGLTVKDGGAVDVVRDNGDRVRLTQGGIEFRRGVDGALRAIMQLDDGSLYFGSVLFDVHAEEDISLRAPIVQIDAYSAVGGAFATVELDELGFNVRTFGNRDVLIWAQDTGTVTLRGRKAEVLGNPGGDGVQVGNGNGPTSVAGTTLTLSTLSGGVRLAAAGTTGSAANCYISGSGQNAQLYQVSSSIRYKQDVEDHHVDQDALLSAVPRSWRDRSEVEADPDTSSRYVGFIAEEIDALGLSEFVVYNPDGTPESVAYDRLAVGLLDVVKTQQQQLAWLAEKVAQLSGETMPDFRPDPTRGVRATRPVPPSPIVEEEVP